MIKTSEILYVTLKYTGDYSYGNIHVGSKVSWEWSCCAEILTGSEQQFMAQLLLENICAD